MAESREDSAKAHRQAVRREILLPFVGGLILIVVLVIIAAVEGVTPTNGVSTTLLTVLILCPMAILLFPIYILLVLAVVGMNRLHDGIAQPLRQLENLTLQLRDRTLKISDRAAQVTIDVNARLAPLDKLVFSLFDRNEDDDE